MWKFCIRRLGPSDRWKGGSQWRALASSKVSWGKPIFVDSTRIAHHIFSCTVVAQTCFYLLSECAQSHIDPMHLHGSSHEAHCLRFAQKHSHLIAQCRTPCRTRRDHARALLPHLFLSQSSSEQTHTCEDRRPQLSGALTEQPHFTGYEPKQIAEDRDYM